MVESKLPTFLRAAETNFSDGSIGKLTTVLGSCVAVVLFDRGGFTAVCHSVLPSRSLMPGTRDLLRSARFVDDAIHEMLAEADCRKIRQHTLVAKLFGGSHIGGWVAKESVGSLNVRVAGEVLAAAGISIVASDVGAMCGRKLVIDLQSGEVLVQRFGVRLN